MAARFWLAGLFTALSHLVFWCNWHYQEVDEMFQRFLNILRGLGRGNQPRAPQAIERLSERRGGPRNAAEQGTQFDFLRDQLDANEFYEAEQSRAEESFHIQEIQPRTRQRRIIRRLTAD